jgi:biopolymer transport protein ExbB
VETFLVGRVSMNTSLPVHLRRRGFLVRGGMLVAVCAFQVGWAASAHAQNATGEIPTQSLLQMALAGGVTIIPIALASFVMLVVVFERLVSLRRSRVLSEPFIHCFLSQVADGTVDRRDALEMCENEASHMARVFAAGVRKWGKPAVEVEQAILDEGERTANVLRKYLRVINGVATVSPLMGLFGTVWGMMQAFNAIASASAMGRPELLAAGISEALITTAAGLVVAIPALILYLYFVGRVDTLVMEIDGYGQELVQLISTEALQDRQKDKKKAAA